MAPASLKVVTDRDEGVYPVIPQGKGYKDMVLDHISNRCSSFSAKEQLEKTEGLAVFCKPLSYGIFRRKWGG